jgi:hypothetical protein
MDDLELYSTIEYTPGWYYKKWPGFYNIECYKVLAHYSAHPEEYHKVEQCKDNGMEECKDNTAVEHIMVDIESDPYNKKCKRKHEDST